MSKPMAISEAVEIAKRALQEFWCTDRQAQALATLEGVRLCDEVEAREIISDMLDGAWSDGLECRARRWLAEHGGE